MKTKLLLIVILSAFLFPMAAGAEKTNNPFESVLDMKDVEYTYISPIMMRGLGNQHISDGDRFYRAQDLDMIVKIQVPPTSVNMVNIESMIKKVIKQNDLEILSSQRSRNGEFNTRIYGKLTKSGENFSSIMILKESQKGGLQLTYITGKINMRALQLLDS